MEILTIGTFRSRYEYDFLNQFIVHPHDLFLCVTPISFPEPTLPLVSALFRKYMYINFKVVLNVILILVLIPQSEGR